MDEPIRFDLATGFELAGGDVLDVWWRYVALGGGAGPELLARRLRGLSDASPRERGRMAQALNELFLDDGIDTFPVAYEPPATAGRGPGEVRRDARRAADRNVVVARRAAELHAVSAELQAVAAELLQRCGRPGYARAALRRADLAERRAATAMSRPIAP